MDTNDDGARWDSDEDEGWDSDEDKESLYWAELVSALRGPRKSLADDRTISPEGRCSIEGIAAARRVSRDPSLILTVIESPPRLQRALLDRHKWARENLAITATVGVYVTIHGRYLLSARAPRRSRTRCRARSAARRGSTRAGPDDDPDPEPPGEAPPHLTASGGAA